MESLLDEGLAAIIGAGGLYGLLKGYKLVIKKRKVGESGLELGETEPVNPVNPDMVTDSDFDKLNTKLDQKFSHIDSQFNNVNTRFDGIDNRIGKVEGQLIKVEDNLNKVDDRLGNLETSVNGLKNRGVSGGGLVVADRPNDDN